LSAYRIAANRIRTTRILSIENQSPTAKTFTFKDKACARAKPGQFLMLWIPRVDEIPLSVLNTEENGTVSVLVKKVGEATEALHNKKIEEIIGVRGPFGNSFTLETGRILIVSGGTGLAPVLFLAKKLTAKAERLVFFVGAKTRDELLFTDELEKICDRGKGRVIATTENGSYGVKGLVTTPLESLLAKEKFDMIYTCGPEQMIRKVFDLAEKYGIALEASLERLMRCAIGLCGSCVIGRYRVCRDGPVFTAKQLKEVKEEFGVSKRDFDGRKIPLE
jgi:dihydroorotate dehydrogenase electron transfer subunit